jgi:hypothetical protein
MTLSTKFLFVTLNESDTQHEWHPTQQNSAERWKRIRCKQNARWQHLSRLKASAFFSLQQKDLVVKKHGNAIWWVMEPYNLNVRLSITTLSVNYG